MIGAVDSGPSPPQRGPLSRPGGVVPRAPVLDLISPTVVIPPAAFAEWVDLAHALAATGLAPCERQPELWWHGTTRVDPAALAGCGACHVREECLAYAVAADERDGLWGGLTATERRQLAAAAA